MEVNDPNDLYYDNPLYDVFSSSDHSETSRIFSFKDSSRYVVHTSSIPLATTANVFLEGNILEKESECTECISGDKHVHYVHEYCPCLQYENIESVCFTEFMKALNANVTKTTESIPVDQFTFCKDGRNILSENYGARLRSITGETGFEKIPDCKTLVQLLRECYWFKFSKVTPNSLGKDIMIAKRVVKQSLFTVNGAIIKRLFMQKEISYREIAKSTASLFDALVREYQQKPLKTNDGFKFCAPVGGTSPYQDMKDFFNEVKEKFNHENGEKRIEAITYGFRNDQVSKFFEPLLTEMYETVQYHFMQMGIDYTETLAWKFQCSILSQTRSMGYLPEWLSAPKAEEYRSNISQQREPITKEIANMIMYAVDRGLEEIPQEVLSKENTIEYDEIIKNIEIDIKGSATVEYTVTEGGKMEELRKIIQFAIQENLELIVYDLKNLEIKEKFLVKDELESYTKIAFWYSFQVVLNYLAEIGRMPKGFYHKLPYFEGKEFLYARILHIQEPGKQRNLTKGTGVYSWFLTPGSKITQKALSFLKSHKDGIESTSDAWKFLMRIHPSNGEGAAFFEERQLKANSEFFYSDWTESTDNIPKTVGITMLQALFRKIDFPEAYGKMIIELVVRPQPVKEVLSVNFEYGQKNFIIWSGMIRHGFMMGNPITKTILHLCHVASERITRDVMEQLGYREDRSIPMITPLSTLGDNLRKYIWTTSQD